MPGKEFYFQLCC